MDIQFSKFRSLKVPVETGTSCSFCLFPDEDVVVLIKGGFLLRGRVTACRNCLMALAVNVRGTSKNGKRAPYTLVTLTTKDVLKRIADFLLVIEEGIDV